MSGISEEESDVLTNLSVLPLYNPIEDFSKWMKLESKDVINSLIKKGWLKRIKQKENENMVFMHDVIQEVVRYRTSPDTEKCKNLIESLTSKLYLESRENPIRKQPYLQPAESLLRHFNKVRNDENLASLANNLSTRHRDLGNLPEALKFQLQAIAIRKEVLDMNNPDLAASYNNLAMIYLDLKNYPLALEYEEKSVAIYQRLFPKGSPKLEQYKKNREKIKMAHKKNETGV